MPDERIYESTCPGCGCHVLVRTEAKGKVGIVYSMLLTDDDLTEEVQEATGEGCGQDPDGDQAVGG